MIDGRLIVQSSGEQCRVRPNRLYAFSQAFFFSCHYTFPRHCTTQALIQESGLQGTGRRGHSSRCSIVLGSSPQSHSKLGY